MAHISKSIYNFIYLYIIVYHFIITSIVYEMLKCPAESTDKHAWETKVYSNVISVVCHTSKYMWFHICNDEVI